MSARAVMNPRLEIDILFAETHIHVQLRGELDCATAPELITALDAIVAHGSFRLVLDFSGLEFFGAAGWHLVADVARRLESLNGSVEVVSASELTARVFEICDPTGTIAVTLSSSSAAARDGGAARYRDDGPRHGRERILNSKGSER